MIVIDPRLQEAKRLIDRNWCRCGGGGMACDDDCPGDTTPYGLREALRLIIEVLEEKAEEK